MKTYTLTWKCALHYGSILRRCRFERGCLYWSCTSDIKGSPDVISAFAFALCVSPSHQYSFRLSGSGLLVARSATYQGL